jgi:hypothetical protein
MLVYSQGKATQARISIGDGAVAEGYAAGDGRPLLVEKVMHANTDVGVAQDAVSRAKVTTQIAEGVDEDRILDAMVEHPILVNRPIVVTRNGVKLCRSSEVVLDLLDRKPESFTKEDGEVVRL